jgi:hypothetical protein
VAGLRAAIELAQAGSVLVVAKDSLRESSSEYAHFCSRVKRLTAEAASSMRTVTPPVARYHELYSTKLRRYPMCGFRASQRLPTFC